MALKAKWTQFANTRMDAVAPSPVPPPGNASYTKVMEAWGSAAMDTTRSKLYVWNGGHTDYSGDEVYAFDPSVPSWTRIKDPTSTAIISASDPVETSGYYATSAVVITPDTAKPRARHNYNTLQYSADVDRFISLNCVFTYPNANSAKALDRFNPATNTWAPGTAMTGTGFGYDCVSAVHPTTGVIWYYAGGNDGYLWDYNPTTQAWTGHGDIFNYDFELNGKYCNAAIDPVTNRMYVFGNGMCGYWALGAGSIHLTTFTSTGPQAMVTAIAPGLDRHAASGLLIAWSGGTNTYSFDPATGAWALLSLDAASAVTPTSAQVNGTFGRFRRYQTNKFLAVNATDQNVYNLEIIDSSASSGPESSTKASLSLQIGI